MSESDTTGRSIGPQLADPAGEVRERAVYHGPRLELLGDIRELTMGGSPGVGDSGSPGTQQPRTGMPTGIQMP